MQPLTENGTGELDEQTSGVNTVPVDGDHISSDMALGLDDIEHGIPAWPCVSGPLQAC